MLNLLKEGEEANLADRKEKYGGRDELVERKKGRKSRS